MRNGAPGGPRCEQSPAPPALRPWLGVHETLPSSPLSTEKRRQQPTAPRDDPGSGDKTASLPGAGGPPGSERGPRAQPPAPRSDSTGHEHVSKSSFLRSAGHRLASPRLPGLCLSPAVADSSRPSPQGAPGPPSPRASAQPHHHRGLGQGRLSLAPRRSPPLATTRRPARLRPPAPGPRPRAAVSTAASSVLPQLCRGRTPCKLASLWRTLPRPPRAPPTHSHILVQDGGSPAPGDSRQCPEMFGAVRTVGGGAPLLASGGRRPGKLVDYLRAQDKPQQRATRLQGPAVRRPRPPVQQMLRAHVPLRPGVPAEPASS